MKITSWIRVTSTVLSGLFLASSLTACSLTAKTLPPSPSLTPLVIDSVGIRCSKQKNADSEKLGICVSITADGQATPGGTVGESRGPWASFSFLCQKTGPSDVWIDAGPLLLTHFTNPEADFIWDPKSYPTIEISIDQGAKKEVPYSIKNMYGKTANHSISLITTYPDIMRDLAGAATLQVWARDSDGVPHEFAFDVENNVAKVATLAAWGMNCKF